ncbi:MAG: hypothetical protein ABEJ42_06710 [Halobacteriaceae archaeon]
MSSDHPDDDAGGDADRADSIAAQLTSAADSTRRKVLVTGAAWTSAGLAGCGSGGGGDGGTTTSATQATTSTTTTPTAPPPANYVVTDDMGTGSEGIPAGESFVSSCSPTRTFVPGMHAIWYVGVYDPQTGDQLTDEDISSLSVTFPERDWDAVELTWAGDDEEHPADEWNGAMVIPEGASPGTVKYTISVTVTDGNSTVREVGILANEFEIIEYTELQYVVSNYTYAISSPDVSSGFVSACGPEWQYQPGMTVAFAANVYNANTGKEPGPDVLDSVTVTFADDAFDPIDLAWQGDAEEHPAKVWESTLDLPEDLATGTYKYEVSITDEDANLLNAGVATDQFTVIDPGAGTTTSSG